MTKKFQKGLPVLLLLLSGIFLLPNCKSDSSEDNKDTSKQDSVISYEPVNEVFFSMPSPSDIAALLVDAEDMEFNPDILNKPENAEKYNSESKVALNLGIYTADLSYAGYFEQPQISRKYFTVTKEMAEDLGITNAVGEKHIKMLSESKLTKEKMTKIINDVFMNTDEYLLENDRRDVMTTILYGGWIEVLYIATNSTEGNPEAKPDLTLRITDQAIVLDILDKLFENAKDENLKKMQDDLTKIKESYATINENMTPENFQAFCNVIKELRTKYIV